MNIVGLIIAIILFIIGIIGTIAPVLPGPILVFLGMLVYGFMTQFQTLSLYFFVTQGLALLLTFIIDFVATAASTKHFGGSKQAQWGAIIGTILGVFISGPLGLLLGPFIGAAGAELIRGIELKDSIRSGIGSIVGAIGGTLLKIIIEIGMIIYFFIVI